MRLITRTTYVGWRVEVVEEPSGRYSQDASLVALRTGGRLRLAAIDGATPSSQAAPLLGLDPAAYAAQLVRLALSGPSAPAEGLAEANLELNRLTVPGEQAPQAQVAVVELDPEGRLSAWRAGDCEVWLEGESGWQALFLEHRLTEEARLLWQGWKEEHQTASLDELVAASTALLADPAWWNSAPVGRYAELKLQEAVGEPTWRQLVLASDGARLTAERLDHLDEWLRELRSFERLEHAQDFKPYDDLTVIRVSRQMG